MNGNIMANIFVKAVFCFKLKQRKNVAKNVD